MMKWRMFHQQSGPAGPRAAATWLGATVALGCGLWLAAHGGPLGLGRRALTADTEVTEEVGWIDRRLATADGPGAIDDPLSECRVAALHWDRAARLEQSEYYRRCGMAWTDDHEQEYGAFRRQYLQKDASGDVAATREAATRALALMAPGRERVRPLWFLALAYSASGQWKEATGALIEITRYKPAPAWVWSLLAEEYQSHGDRGRQDLAEEQAWRANTRRPISAYMSAVIRHTPYARPAVCPAWRGQPEKTGNPLARGLGGELRQWREASR